MIERFIAIDNVCAWPNLTLMPDGAIIATIFNQPIHGRWEGDIECWASTDAGCLWTLRGVPARHEPGTNRMNAAAGLTNDGTFIVIGSGYPDMNKPGSPKPKCGNNVLAPWVCLSTDNGHSWKHSETVTIPDGVPAFIPFGDIERTPDALGVTFYSWYAGEKTSAYFLQSRDNGLNWSEAVVIGADDYAEADLLCLDGRRWLAVVRTLKDGHLDLFISEDRGQNWKFKKSLTLPGQHPGHLLRLADKRILLTYGIRNRGLCGIAVRLSSDEGDTWSEPNLILDLGIKDIDCGYPSSVQIPDGTIVTAYYAIGVQAHQRYHMGVLRWNAIDEYS